MSEKIRDSFIFYRSFYQSAKKLPKEDKAELFDAICSYALDGELVELSVVPEAIFTVIKPNLDANRRKWENGCKEKKKPSEVEAIEEQEISKDEANDKQTISKPEGNVNVDVNVECKSESKSKRFSHPTLEEVKNYCQERKNNVNAKKWFDFYSAKGWKIGKNSMKDWKAAVRTWEEDTSPTNQDPITNKLNQIAGGSYFKSVVIGNEVIITCNDGMKTKAYSLPEEIKNKIKAEFKQSIQIN
jgi:hypothetical protein